MAQAYNYLENITKNIHTVLEALASTSESLSFHKLVPATNVPIGADEDGNEIIGNIFPGASIVRIGGNEESRTIEINPTNLTITVTMSSMGESYYFNTFDRDELFEAVRFALRDF